MFVLGCILSIVFAQYWGTDIPDELISLYVLGIFLFLFVVVLGWFPRATILIRRIRDTGRDQKWMFWILIPFIGWIILILLALQPSFSSTRDTSQVIGVENFNEEDSDKKTKNNSLQSKLEELKRLKKEDLISEEEYEKLRKKILDL
tara:strand:+ start:145 stop:585 length:441 start_codon:yes stop_codon:yes gene_type:complete